jgi:hypothetical protein
MHAFASPSSQISLLSALGARARASGAICLASWLALGCAPQDASHDALEWRASVEPTFVSLGEGTTCATLAAGAVKCWGDGDGGRLGLGRPVSTSEPDPVELEPIALGGAATRVATSGAQTFALLDDGTVRGFGLNAAHELGLSHAQTVGDDETPSAAGSSSVVPLGGAATELAAGDGFACARLVDGRVQCWGRGDEGQLGRGVVPGFGPPADVILGGTAVEIAVGAAHACARLTGGAVRCWGRDDAGQLGHGQAEHAGSTPAMADVPLGGTAVEVTAGADHTCARLSTGTIRCWGDGADGRLGYGSTEAIGDDETPAAAGDVALGATAIQVAAGQRHTCALLEDGALRCWGDGSQAQLGLPSSAAIGDDELPIETAAIDLARWPITPAPRSTTVRCAAGAATIAARWASAMPHRRSRSRARPATFPT